MRRPARPRFEGLWRNHDFLRLWAAQTISVFGSLVTRTALPFAAILTLDASPFQVAVLGAMDIAPGLLSGLAAGVWVDRLRRRPIMIAADLGRALLLVSIPLAAWWGVLRIEHLYVVAFLAGILTTFFDIAYLSYLPSLVRRDDLVEGNSKLAASLSVAEVGAFGLSGWLVQIFTAPFAIALDALSFIVSALFLGRIRTPEPQPEQTGERRRSLTEAREGLRVLLADPLIRALAFGSIALEASYRVTGAVYLIFVTRQLGFETGLLGMIFAVGGISSFFGAVTTRRITARVGIGPALVVGLILTGIGHLLVPAARDASLVAAALLIAPQIIGDSGATVFWINQLSLRQAITPPAVLGRVNATVEFLNLAFMLAGTLLAGLAAERFGLRPVLVTGGLIALGAGVALYFTPVRRVTTTPEAGPDPLTAAAS